MAIKLPDTITPPMWWRMVDYGMSLPEPLITADISRPFVYCRGWGYFPVSPANHSLAMALLQAWKAGHNNIDRVTRELNLSDISEVSDYWLINTPGAAYLSSVSRGRVVMVGRRSNLNDFERDIFGKVNSLED